ncbi:MAG: T9SS type A sorting domain-containing protein, partial [Saprospiraceae bacterium]|nr:T9SS type A sorting domain-containing protein [Saprospiraceae bacterium]
VTNFSYFLTDTLRLDELGRKRHRLLTQEVLDWESCEWLPTQFCDSRYGLGEGIGIVWEGWICFLQGWTRELIGYKIGEETLGDIALIQIINDVQEPSAALPLQISPNPGQAFIDLTLPSAFIHSNDLELSLFDAQGKWIKTIYGNSNGPVLQMDVEFLPAGLYMLRLRCREGIAVGKWVKG